MKLFQSMVVTTNSSSPVIEILREYTRPLKWCTKDPRIIPYEDSVVSSDSAESYYSDSEMSQMTGGSSTNKEENLPRKTRDQSQRCDSKRSPRQRSRGSADSSPEESEGDPVDVSGCREIWRVVPVTANPADESAGKSRSCSSSTGTSSSSSRSNSSSSSSRSNSSSSSSRSNSSSSSSRSNGSSSSSRSNGSSSSSRSNSRLLSSQVSLKSISNDSGYHEQSKLSSHDITEETVSITSCLVDKLATKSSSEEETSDSLETSTLSIDCQSWFTVSGSNHPEVGKASLKLTLKAVRPTASPSPPTPRPQQGLKLTLPKPVTYPYTSRPGVADCWKAQATSDVAATGPVLTENRDKSRRPWTVVSVKQPANAGGEENATLKTTPKNEPATFKKNVLRIKLRPSDSEKGGESVYDFHDSDEDDDCLTIDDSPAKKRKPSLTYPCPSGSLKFKSLMSPGSEDLDVAGEVDVVSDSPKNGIEELLKASCYATDGSREQDSGRASSPSTRDAIDGMMMIKQGVSLKQSASKADQASRLRRKKVLSSDDDGENMDKVHQDDEYVYPGLDTSDDESIFKPRGKKKLDEAWNPKARVGPLLPKTDRPMREGTKKQSVEKGLEAAALKRAGLPPPKRPYNRKKARVVPAQASVVVVEPRATTSTSATSATSNTSTSTSTSPKKVELKTNSNTRKPKKGMATVKQRLGKILKIHKMKF